MIAVSVFYIPIYLCPNSIEDCTCLYFLCKFPVSDLSRTYLTDGILFFINIHVWAKTKIWYTGEYVVGLRISITWKFSMFSRHNHLKWIHKSEKLTDSDLNHVSQFLSCLSVAVSLDDWPRMPVGPSSRWTSRLCCPVSVDLVTMRTGHPLTRSDHGQIMVIRTLLIRSLIPHILFSIMSSNICTLVQRQFTQFTEMLNSL